MQLEVTPRELRELVAPVPVPGARSKRVDGCDIAQALGFRLARTDVDINAKRELVSAAIESLDEQELAAAGASAADAAPSTEPAPEDPAEVKSDADRQ